MPFREPSFRQQRTKTWRDVSTEYCPHGLFSLKQSCTCSNAVTTWSHKITVPMKSWCTREKQLISFFFLSPDHLLSTFFFLIYFYVQWYKFSRSVLSPLLVWSLHTSRHRQRDERRPSANQSILLTLLFIYFLSPSATAQLPLCVCERGMGKEVGILVETEEPSTCNCSCPLSFLLPCYPLFPILIVFCGN